MARPFLLYLIQSAVSRNTAIEMPGDRLLVCHWLRETILVWVRWLVVPLFPLLIPLFPTIFRPLVVLHAVALALGNAGMHRLLHPRPSLLRLRWLFRLATAMEWFAALGVLTLFVRDPASRAPAVLLMLHLLTCARYGQRGVIGATVAAALLSGVFVGAQAFLNVVEEGAAWDALKAWELLVALMALMMTGLVWARDEWHRREEVERGRAEYACRNAIAGERKWAEQALAVARAEWEREVTAQRQRERTEYLQWQSGLSNEEWNVLQLLPYAEMTYKQIGARLNMSEGTVKAHVSHIGDKLELADARGRWAVVVEARKRGWLSPVPEPPVPDE